MAIFTTKEIAATRLSTCFSCEQISNSAPRCCDLCSCYMRAKVQLRNASCPLGKWSKSPLVRSEHNDFAEYWHDENEIIEAEMATVAPDKAQYALSSHRLKGVKN